VWIFLVVSWGASFGQAGSKPKCGAGQAGSSALNLKDEAMCAAFDIVHASGKPDTSIFDAGYGEDLFYLAIEQPLAHKEVKEVSEKVQNLVTVKEETKRTDKQTGASPNAEGSTSVAEKANFADLLAVAVENGTIQQETNGTTLTLSSSPYALTTWAHGDTATNYQNHENDLARIGVSATFNISNQEDVLSNATRKQLAEWSVRVRLNRDHTTRSKAFEAWWQKNAAERISQEAVVVTGEIGAIFRKAPKSVAMSKVLDKFRNSGLDHSNPAAPGDGFIKAYLDAHAGDSDDQLVAGLRDELLLRLKTEASDRVDSFGLNDDEKKRIVAAVADLAPAHALATQALKDVSTHVDELNRMATYTLAYTNVRDTTTSDYSVVKFLLEKATSNTGKLVFNVGGSLYSKPDRTKNEQTVRDYATALSWETQLGRSPLVLYDVDQGQMTLSFAGRYQRLLENRHQPDKKADLAVVQVKFEIPVFSGVTFPISVSYATASELLKEDHVHANFGFSFDTDKLYQLLAFKKKQGAVQ
jgi:hypothetical protein